MVKFRADPKSTYKRCVIQDRPHSDQPGVWPSGKMASDVCSRHMEFWKSNQRAQNLALATPKKKLWFLGKRG